MFFSGMNHLFKGAAISELLIYSALAILLVFLSLKYIKWRETVKLMNKIPGHEGNFLVGNALQVNVPNRELFKLFMGILCDYGRSMSKVWLFSQHFVLLHKAESAEVILSSSKHIRKDTAYDYLVPWLGTGLLISTGSKWHTRRKMLTPTFHFKILDDFVEVFNKQADIFVSKLAENGSEKYFNVFGYVTKCTLDIILETAMGISIEAQDNPESDYVKAVYTMSSLTQIRASRPWLYWDIVYKLLGYKKSQDEAIVVLHQLSNSIIANRRNEFRKYKEQMDNTVKAKGFKKRLAFLDLLVAKAEEDKSLTNEDIREEVDTFVFEGHDTTAAGVSFAMFLLACHPEIQEKVHEEIDTIFQGSNRPATADDLRQMKYLECCIKEALRIYPSVPFIGRYLTEPVEIDGYMVPAKTTALIMNYRIHRDPTKFPEPEKFIPERFFPENAANRHPFAYIPFSAGPRNCIGQKFALMEEKVVLSSVFRKFRVESAVQPKDLPILGELIIRPENGMHLRFHPRN